MEFNIFCIAEHGQDNHEFAYPSTNSDGSIRQDAWDHGIEASFTAKEMQLQKMRKGGKLMEEWSLDETSVKLYVTDSRIIFQCVEYDHGDHWVGGGTAVIMTAISKARAKARTKGTSLLGQIRYEWLPYIGYQRKRGWLGKEALRVAYWDSEDTLWVVTLSFEKQVDTSVIANLIYHKAAAYRMQMQDNISDKLLSFYQNAVGGANIVPSTDSDEMSIIRFPESYYAPGASKFRPTNVTASCR